MTAPFHLDGISPIINTPFTDELAIDWASLDRLLARAVADGVVGCIVPAVASEVGSLTEAERHALVEAVAGRVGGSITVIAGVSADDLGTSIRHAEHALRAGCEVVLCRVPEPLIDDPAGLVAHFEALARVGMPTIMVQDLAWGGPGLPVASIVRLAEAVPAVRAIKVETSPAARSTRRSARRQVVPSTCRVAGGWAR
jgi:dihydrodipicolinate synthase/N-acetylneuraminate lyase